jgi:hypothetical protein
MKKDRRRSITKEQFEKLVSFDGWEHIHDVPKDQWPLLPAPFSHPDTIAVVTSGILTRTNSIAMHGIDNIVGGIDWLRFEPEGKRYSGETAGNAYHFVITENSDGDHNLYGPFTACLPLPHHFDDVDLPAYIDRFPSYDDKTESKGESQ